MIDVQIVSKTFGMTMVMQNIHIQIARHERIAILGPSGVGKTTLMRIIAGLDTDFEGFVKTDASIAMMFQEPTLMPWRTAIDNLVLATGVKRERAAQILIELGLGDQCDHFPNQMSLGQQRRVSLARALCTEPDMLVMDEPFASLDVETARDMMDLVNTTLTGRKTALLLVTHAPNEARVLTDRQIVLSGNPATLVVR